MSENPENPENLEVEAAEVLEISEEPAKEDVGVLQDRLLRLAADFENFKKRAEKDRQLSVKFANEILLRDLLPILDHLEQALIAADPKDVIVVGVKMVLKQFEEVLGRYGVKSFSALGQSFNPSQHEAVEEREEASVPAGQVIAEHQKGYFLHDRLVRAARVVVSKGA